CSPRLRLREVRDLAKHTMIHFEWRRRRRENATWDRWLKAARMPGLTPKADLIFTDESQAIQAAISGHGVALLSRALVSDDTRVGTLMQPFGPTLQMEGYRYDFVYLPERKDSEAIAALRRWIRKELPES